MGTALALVDPSYSAPALAYSGELAESEDVVWWIVVVGFAAFAGFVGAMLAHVTSVRRIVDLFVEVATSMSLAFSAS